MKQLNPEKIRKFLHKLQQVSASKQHSFIRKAKAAEIRALLHIAYNYLKGGASKLAIKDRKRINQRGGRIRELAIKCLSHSSRCKNGVLCRPEGIVKARQLLQRGGFFPALIPLIAAIAPLIGKAALAGAVSAGTGLAVKKIAENV